MAMEQKIFHGDFSTNDLVECLLIHFNRGNLHTQQILLEDRLAVQIQTRDRPSSGGETALSIIFQKVPDGVAVQMGKQTWLGVAASLGYSALASIKNPFNLLHRLDDIAQDIEYLQLSDEVWKVLESNARSLGTGYDLSQRLKRITCSYCGIANQTGEPACIACGAPLGPLQPISCKNCGYILSFQENICPNCKKPIS